MSAAGILCEFSDAEVNTFGTDRSQHMVYLNVLEKFVTNPLPNLLVNIIFLAVDREGKGDS